MKTWLYASAISLASLVPAHAVPVDLELQLLVDVSGSVSGGEFDLQRDGYADAFRSSDIFNAITGGSIGSIAAQLIYWAGSSSQQVAVDWAFIDSETASLAFGDAIAAASRPFFGSTSIDAALNFGRPLFDDNGFEGTRLVQDVSGDGSSGISATQAARDASAAAGITVNGLPIGGSTFLESFYRDNVITSDGFIVSSNSFDDFGIAVSQKLQREITDDPGVIPLPAGGLLLISGLAAIGGFARRRKKG